MTDEQIHITALTEMFLGLGHEPTPERIAYYARLLKNVPAKYIRVACDHAVAASTSGFPPSPGEIIKQAERIHRDLILSAREAEHEKARLEFEAERARLMPSEDAEAIAKMIEDSLRN